MRFSFSDTLMDVAEEPVIGNVYPLRGGSGARKGYMQLVISLTETGCVMLTIDREGQVVGASCYRRNYIAEKTPIAFCDGLEELSFTVRGI